MSEWQPIETAPERTPILAMEDFQREDEDGKKYPRDYQVVAKINGKWASFGIYLESFEPTHWMPLPEPPKTDTLADTAESQDKQNQSVKRHK